MVSEAASRACSLRSWPSATLDPASGPWWAAQTPGRDIPSWLRARRSADWFRFLRFSVTVNTEKLSKPSGRAGSGFSGGLAGQAERDWLAHVVYPDFGYIPLGRRIQNLDTVPSHCPHVSRIWIRSRTPCRHVSRIWIRSPV